ncbi:MAG: NifB/NifX family molybdenum-iron cluster-binding protein [Oscillospiraceae bacterium]|jgi:predicted Fe-Mo cluster-binding NifX family protein|nr:NifB/NifX family molybdenum-iron cluster-binding protein [Oscillospiraceae bacterium]
MKIAIPVNDNSEQTKICPSFGRTPFYLIADTDSGERVIFENTAANQAGGAGIAAAQSLVDRGVEVVISPRCGENAARVLSAADIKMYKMQSDSVEENLKAFSEGSLVALDDIHPGFHGHGDTDSRGGNG